MARSLWPMGLGVVGGLPFRCNMNTPPSGLFTFLVKLGEMGSPWLVAACLPFPLCDSGAMFLAKYVIFCSVEQKVLVLNQVADVCT